MNKNNICFEYEKLFALPHSIGGPIITDLMKNFGHSGGAFVEDDDGGRKTAYQLGQQSVINYIISQINTAKKSGENK